MWKKVQKLVLHCCLSSLLTYLLVGKFINLANQVLIIALFVRTASFLQVAPEAGWRFLHSHQNNGFGYFGCRMIYFGCHTTVKMYQMYHIAAKIYHTTAKRYQISNQIHYFCMSVKISPVC
jgi:hypothetical protein